MTYQSNIPLGTDAPSSSASEFRTNFSQIATLIAANHEAFNTADAGKHKFLQMPQQGSAPATAADEGGLYTKDVSGSAELFYRAESSGSEYQITNAFTAATTGDLTLPGGLGIRWGTGTTVGTTLAVSYSSPFTTATYVVQITSLSAGATTIFSASSYAVGGFLCTASNSTESFAWMAIGL